MATETETKSTQKMLANLRAGDRIQFSYSELGLPSSMRSPSSTLTSTVVIVRKLREGWHQVETTDYGVLNKQDPTYRYSVIQ
ncbi:MAG: hypothetical protein WBB28_28210 [Crinalium sp.]